MKRPGHPVARRLLTAGLCLSAGLILGVAPRGASAQSVWELTPYRIQLIVALSPRASLGAESAADLRNRLCQRAATVVGAGWDVKSVEPSPSLRYRMTTALASLRFEDLPPDVDKFDKVFLVAVASDGSGREILAREFDARVRVFSPVLRRPVWQTSKLCDTIFQTILDVFTPLAQVTKTTQNEVTLRLRAGGLPPRDQSLPQVKPGHVFQPMMRYSDRDGAFRKNFVVPWTFLVVEKIDADALHCSLHSAMLSPMSGRRRGRVEALALAVRPAGRSTSLVLRGRVEPKPLLAGYPIYEQKIGSKETKPLGRTDLDGRIEIGPGEHPMRLVLVKSGKALLARLPIVPGLEPEVTAEIRDDDQRLEAEGFTTAMQLELIDIVTRQKILIERVKNLLEADRVDEADKVLVELQTLPTEETLLRDLRNQQGRIHVEDKWTAKKVEELFDETRTLLRKYLNTAPVKELARDVAAARRPSAEKVTPETPPPRPPAKK